MIFVVCCYITVVCVVSIPNVFLWPLTSDSHKSSCVVICRITNRICNRNTWNKLRCDQHLKLILAIGTELHRRHVGIFVGSRSLINIVTRVGLVSYYVVHTEGLFFTQMWVASNRLAKTLQLLFSHISLRLLWINYRLRLTAGLLLNGIVRAIFTSHHNITLSFRS